MSRRERQTTRLFQVRREDGSRYVAIEVTTFLSRTPDFGVLLRSNGSWVAKA